MPVPITPLPVPITPPIPAFGTGEGFGLGPFGGTQPPVYVYPVTPTPTEDQVLGGNRLTAFYFEVLDQNEKLLEVLDGVNPVGSSLTWDTTTAVKGSGTLVLHDTILDGLSPANIAWADVRIRVSAIIQPLDGSTEAFVYPLGIWLPAAPIADWTDLGRRWSVALLDKTSILDKDVIVDSDGNAVTFSVKVGDNVLATIIGILTAMGESTTAITIPTSPPLMATNQTWDAGTTKLVIINDLLASIGYYSIYCDYSGQFQCTPYALPNTVSPTYSFLAPFTDTTPLMAPTWTFKQDIYSIPNRYVGVSQGSGNAAALIATAVLSDESPFSHASRGFWVTVTEKSITAIDMDALSTYVQNKLQKASSSVAEISVSHVLLPELSINQTVQFKNDAQGFNQRVLVSNMTIELDPTAMCSATLTEAIDVKGAP